MQLVLPLPQGLDDLFASDELVELEITISTLPNNPKGIHIRKIAGEFLLKGEIGDHETGVTGILQSDELTFEDSVIAPSIVERLAPKQEESKWWEIVQFETNRRNPEQDPLEVPMMSGTRDLTTAFDERVKQLEEVLERGMKISFTRIELRCGGVVKAARDFV